MFDQSTIFSVKTCGSLKYNIGICELNVMIIAILLGIFLVLVLTCCCCLCCGIWCSCRKRSKRIVKEEEMKFLDSKAEIRERSSDRQVAHVENSVPNAMLTYASVICYSRTMCLHCGQTFRCCGAELSSWLTSVRNRTVYNVVVHMYCVIAD